MMRITVKYFGLLKKETGKDEEKIEIKQQSATAEEVVAHLEKKLKNLKKRIQDEQLLIAVNHEYVELGAEVKDGDEVAFFPPVAGG
ncbi:MAG: molybdopterin converting factor subunit 1 [Candidatus Thermoplasmatota archaeon]|nr:molybdopterin converting factor subunit 1 [Candidatus Thermoplasmatota archaeon]